MSVEATNLMSRNFVSGDMGESKYSRAREAAANARGQMSNRQSSILAAGIAACATCDTLAERILEGKKAASRMGMDMRQNITENSRETLDRLKEKLEEKGTQKHESDASSRIIKKDIPGDGCEPESSSQSPAVQGTALQFIAGNSPVPPGELDIEV